MKRLSLSTRLLFTASLILLAFLSITAIGLENAFQASAERAQKKQLRNTVYSLLAVADFTEAGEIIIPVASAIPELTVPNSGLYAAISKDDEIIWRSESFTGLDLLVPNKPNNEQESFALFSDQEEQEYINLSYNIVWENDSNQQFAFTFNVIEDLAAIKKEKADFRQTLLSLLGGTGIVLLIVQLIVLRWSLKPLSTAANDLQAIENGEQSRLTGDYPKELNHLTQNINALLDQEQARRSRYKHALADLAHSIKTPLALMRTEMSGEQSQEQINKIAGLVDYQLQRAATEGKTSLQAPIELNLIINKIISSLDKVYQQKQIDTEFNASDSIQLHGDEGDIYELIGNVLENSYKYCFKKVRITVEKRNNEISIVTEDDGPGIPDTEKQAILKRGRRIDTHAEGQGIGLAIVSDIVSAYQGKIEITNSQLGGACFTLILPSR